MGEAAEALDEVVVMLGARGVRFALAAAEAGGALLADAQQPGMRIATIDRAVHPALDAVRYEMIDGVANVTRFLTELPDMAHYPGYVLGGYAIERAALVPEKGIDGQTMLPSKYEYAKHWRRPDDGLRLLGYDVVDEPAHPFSILHSGPWSLSEVIEACGPLNSFGLFGTPEAARRFCDFVRAENEEEGMVWQVWG